MTSFYLTKLFSLSNFDCLYLHQYPCAKGRNRRFPPVERKHFVVGSINCHSESENFLKFLLTRANFSRFNPGDVSWRFRHRDIGATNKLPSTGLLHFNQRRGFGPHQDVILLMTHKVLQVKCTVSTLSCLNQ
jgi:hypothetical protein